MFASEFSIGEVKFTIAWLFLCLCLLELLFWNVFPATITYLLPIYDLVLRKLPVFFRLFRFFVLYFVLVAISDLGSTSISEIQG